MSPRKTHFAWGLLLLTAACLLFLASGFGEPSQLVQVDERLYRLMPGSLELSLGILAPLIPFVVVLGSLGCVQDLVSLPDTVKRICACLIAAGILLAGVSLYVLAFNFGDLDSTLQRARWIAFAGFLMGFLPIFLQFFAFSRTAGTGNDSGTSGEKKMRVARVYALGGLLLVLWALIRGYWAGMPWQDHYVVGMTKAVAGLFTWPLAASLGAAAMFLSAVQTQLGMENRLGLTASIVYFLGAGVFLSSLHSDLAASNSLSSLQMSWPTSVGLGLVSAVLLVNLIALLRQREAPGNALPQAQ